MSSRGLQSATLEAIFALRRDDFIREHQIRHAVRLVGHAHGEFARRNTLEIGGIVVGGEGVLLAARIGDELGKFALLMVLGALEHEMFEKMRDA